MEVPVDGRVHKVLARWRRNFGNGVKDEYSSDRDRTRSLASVRSLELAIVGYMCRSGTCAGRVRVPVQYGGTARGCHALLLGYQDQKLLR